jgi:hypothetical protein
MPGDRKKWTFKLRSGVSFHDGTPFNADAVIWNLDRTFKRGAPHFDPQGSAINRGRPTYYLAEDGSHYGGRRARELLAAGAGHRCQAAHLCCRYTTALRDAWTTVSILHNVSEMRRKLRVGGLRTVRSEYRPGYPAA